MCFMKDRVERLEGKILGCIRVGLDVYSFLSLREEVFGVFKFKEFEFRCFLLVRKAYYKV